MSPSKHTGLRRMLAASAILAAIGGFPHQTGARYIVPPIAPVKPHRNEPEIIAAAQAKRDRKAYKKQRDAARARLGTQLIKP